MREVISCLTDKRFMWIVLAGWGILFVLYFGVSRYYKLQINVTTSMPQKLWLTSIGNRDLQVGDYVVIKFHFINQAPSDYEYVVKQVGGIGGDRIMVKSVNHINQVDMFMFYNDRQTNISNWVYVLAGKAYAVYDNLSGKRFEPLTIEDMVIPHGHYFLHGQQQPSFDSRYKSFGLVSESQIYGKTYPIF